MQEPLAGALALALTLVSGAVMMLAGYVGHTDGWASAGLITTAGGIVILPAFTLARRAAGPDPGPRGVPTGSPAARSVATTAATLLSGGVMVLAGYAGAAWWWGLAAPLAAVGGLVIAAAFFLDRGRA